MAKKKRKKTISAKIRPKEPLILFNSSLILKVNGQELNLIF